MKLKEKAWFSTNRKYRIKLKKVKNSLGKAPGEELPSKRGGIRLKSKNFNR